MPGYFIPEGTNVTVTAGSELGRDKNTTATIKVSSRISAKFYSFFKIATFFLFKTLTFFQETSFSKNGNFLENGSMPH